MLKFNNSYIYMPVTHILVSWRR